MKPRALVVTPSVGCGGAEQWILDLVRFTRSWIEWLPVCCVGRLPPQNKLADFMDAGVTVMIGIDGLPKLLAQNPDVIVTWGGAADWMSNVALRAPVIWSARTVSPAERSNYLALRQFKPIYTAVSRSCMQQFLPEDIPNVTVIPNGIDCNRLGITVPRSELRASYGIRDDKFVVGYLGRLDPEKRPDLLAQALTLLPENFVGFFVGNSKDFDKDVARLMGIAGDRLTIAPWTRQPGNYLNAFDCYVSVSIAEGMSRAVLEAMYCKVPCILTSLGYLDEIKEIAGQFWVELGLYPTPTRIAQAILTVAEMPKNELETQTQYGHRIVLEQFSAQKMARNWAKFIYNVLGRCFHET